MGQLKPLACHDNAAVAVPPRGEPQPTDQPTKQPTHQHTDPLHPVACSNSTAGQRYVVNTSPTVYQTPCATTSTGVTLRRCQAFNYTGTKQFNACGDGRCWRQLSVGGPAGWIQEDGTGGADVSSIPATACASGEGPPWRHVCACAVHVCVTCVCVFVCA